LLYSQEETVAPPAVYFEESSRRPPHSLNQAAEGGVLSHDVNEHAAELPRGLLNVSEELDREFEARLLESSTLAFRIAYSVLQHREDAEDVTQEAFAKAHRKFAQLRDRGRFRAWLVRITWRLALDRRRADTRRSVRESAQTASQALSQDEQRVAAIWRAIDALPEKLRMVVVLASVEGHDTSEVARLLGIPEGTVKSRLFMARKRLKEELK
jgi:RNA polymerase sigma-70 factor (ECF subfamily)